MNKLETTLELQPEEYKVVSLMRKLPPEQSIQLLTFARFLFAEAFQPIPAEWLEEELSDLDNNGSTDEIEMNVSFTENDVRWDELLASADGQSALDKLADEALAQIRAGHVTAISFTEDNEIEPAVI